MNNVYKIPEEFIERYQKFIPDFERFLRVIQTPVKPSFRINTLKINKEQALSKLIDIKLKPIPWIDIGYWVLDRLNIGDSQMHKDGYIYIQEAVSMIPALVLNPKPTDKVLDMCAAPGSKTTQLAALMNNQGVIIANDISPKRIKALRDNLSRMGVKNTKTIRKPAQRLGYYYPEYFDMVLLDAPCSLEGTIRNSPEVLLQWKKFIIKRLSKMQKGLINSAFKALKPNGVLVYSTCTFAPEENEEVVDYLFTKYQNLKCEQIELNGIITHCGLTAWHKDKYHPELSKAIRIYPHDNDTEGFFIVKIRKL